MLIAHIAHPVCNRDAVEQRNNRSHSTRVTYVKVGHRFDPRRAPVGIPVESWVLRDKIFIAHWIKSEVAVAAIGARPQVFGDRGFQREYGIRFVGRVVDAGKT